MSAQLAVFKVPVIENEPMVRPACLNPVALGHASPVPQKTYALGSPERTALQAAITQMEQELPFEVPVIINGEAVRLGRCMRVLTTIDHSTFV